MDRAVGHGRLCLFLLSQQLADWSASRGTRVLVWVGHGFIISRRL